MRKFYLLSGIIAVLFLTPMSSYAGDWSKDQKAVWATIGAQWEASKAKDYDKWGSYLADDFQGWSNEGAIPSDKASEISWIKFGSEQNKTLKYQLSPVKIVVHDKTAVAHYYFVSVNENKEGKRKTNTGRWTDVLVRDGKSWKFIGWQGGSDSDND